MIASNDKTPVVFTLSGGNAHDAPQGRLLMETVGKQKASKPLVLDMAYEDNFTRYTAQALGFGPVVPPKKNRKKPWEYDKELYKRRNEVERLFRHLMGFRRIFTRFEKLDRMYIGFVQLALVYVRIR